MKRVIVLLNLLFYTIIFSQNNDCKLKAKFDDFEKTNTYTISNQLLGGGLGSTLSYDFLTITKEETREYIIILHKLGKNGECISPDSYVTFLFENGDTLTLNFKGKIDCGTSSIYFKLTKDNLEYLINNSIDKIRLRLDYSSDYTIKEKRDLKFKEKLKCFLVL